MGHGEGIKLTFLPPLPFVPSCVVFGMMDRAKGNSEFIAHLEPETSWLGVSDVMGMARRSPANETGLVRYEGKCSLDRCRFGSLMVRTLLSIFGRATVETRGPGLLWRSLDWPLLRFSGLTSAMAHCFK
jgi:hypothetical protein